MPTIQKFYCHDANTTDTGTLPGASSLSATAPSKTATTASTNRAMTSTKGTAQVSIRIATSITDTQDWFRRFLSVPLGVQSVASGSWTFDGGFSSSNSTSGDFLTASLFQWRPSTGVKVATIFDSLPFGPGSTTTGETDHTGSQTGSAFTLADGDILVLEVYAGPAGVHTATDTFYYDGTTEGSNTSNAAFLNAPVAINLSGTVSSITSTLNFAYSSN